MRILNSTIRIAAKPFPRAISPQAHVVLDYLTVGSLFLSAAWFWRRSKRAAIGALISGAAELAVSLLTDYPGGVKKIINFRTHREIDFGLAAMTANMPEFLAFKDEKERKFFLAEGAMITAISELTRAPGKALPVEKKFAV